MGRSNGFSDISCGCPMVTAVTVCVLTSISAGMAFGSTTLISLRLQLSPDMFGWCLAVFYAGCITGAVMSAFLMTRFGRHWTIQYACLPSLVGWLCLHVFYFNTNVMDPMDGFFIVGRFLVALGSGLTIPSVTVYLIEIGSSSSIGFFGSLVQVGLMIGLTTIQLLIPLYSWETITYLSAFIVLITNGLLFLLPESPKWISSTRVKDAETATDSSLGMLLEDTKSASKVEHLIDSDTFSESTTHPLRLFFTTNTCRFLKIFIYPQILGYGALIYFCDLLFTYNSSTWVSLYAPVIGLPQVLAAILASLLADRINVKSMLLFSTVATSLGYFILGVMLMRDEFKNTNPLILLGVAISLFGFQIGWGPLPGVIVCQSYPSSQRGYFIGILMALAWIVQFIFAITFEIICSLFIPSNWFLFLSTLCLLLILLLTNNFPLCHLSISSDTFAPNTLKIHRNLRL